MSQRRTATLAKAAATRRRRDVQAPARSKAAPAATETHLLFTVVEAAELLGIGRTTIYELVWSGRLTPVRIGRSVRFTRAELDAFVNDLATRR